MTKPDDGTLATPGDRPTMEGALCAALDFAHARRPDFNVYADAKANALYEWAYWERLLTLVTTQATSAWRRVDAAQHGGAA